VATAVIVQFIGTFGVWIIAERLQLSGILTMVVYAMTVARTAPDVIPARIRIPSYAVWEVAVFLLNALAFVLVGLQLKPIVQDLGTNRLLSYTGVALGVCAAVVLVRIVWVMGATELRGPRTTAARRHSAVVAWAGMRGTVTLAAALALPARFPYRDLILFTSFSVVLVTLVVQGLTLKPLMARLGLEHDDSVEREVRLARVEALRAGVAALAGQASGGEPVELLRRTYQTRLDRAEARMNAGGAGAGPGAGEREHALAANAAERRRLSALRAEGTIGDDAFHRVEEELDRAELSIESSDPQE
jgi:CPA1 family monovalent cation:H+ antiporter